MNTIKPLEFFASFLYNSTNQKGEMLRIAVIDDSVNIFVNNLETQEGAGYDISCEEIVEFCKALLKAWEIKKEKENKNVR